MGIPATAVVNYQVDGVVRTGNIVRQDGHRQVWIETIPADETNYPLSANFAVADLKQLFMMASRGVTLKTNDGTTPDDTFTLPEKEPTHWAVDNNIVCPITQDVTGWFVDTPAGADTVLTIEALIDPSP